MPRIGTNPTDGRDPRECPECHRIIARKGDLPRHLRIHLDPETKNSLSYKCPYDGCKFANLQKSNVDTHLRTHTNEKSILCPDFELCRFATNDPAALTRHRKRRHDYVPRPRKRRAVASQPTPGGGTGSSTEGSVMNSNIDVNANTDSISTTASPGVDVDPSTAPTLTTPGPLIFPVFTPATIPRSLDIHELFQRSESCVKISGVSENNTCSDGNFWGPLPRSLAPKILFPAYESAPALYSAQISSEPELGVSLALEPNTDLVTGNLKFSEHYLPMTLSVIAVVHFWLFRIFISTIPNILGLVTMQVNITYHTTAASESNDARHDEHDLSVDVVERCDIFSIVNLDNVDPY